MARPIPPESLHPHAPALLRIGRDVVQEHFAITRQTMHQWLTNGVPPSAVRPVVLLASALGHPAPELPPVVFPPPVEHLRRMAALEFKNAGR